MSVWDYLSIQFVQNALIVGTLIALCSSLLGVTLVLKRFSFIGDGLSHVAFGAMAVAGVLGPALKELKLRLGDSGFEAGLSGVLQFFIDNEMMFILPVTIVCAVLLLRTGQNTRIKGDAALAMISVGALAMGYMLLNLFPKSSNVSSDVCTSLFGSTSILTLTMSEVWLSVVLSIAVMAIFLVFYNKIFAVTFDEDFARASGTHAEAYNLLIAVVIAVIIVLAMNLVGSLLISALIIFPAMSAMRVIRSFKGVTICSAVLSVSCALLGMIISILTGTPVGSTIVAADIAAFLICSILARLGVGTRKA
ncbi:MAG: metal ABC transporter permease [Clostridia bacterium]|nr:metal ABC transporter permease [Clostridia bacterium]